MKRDNTAKWIGIIVSVFAPLLFFSMFIPIWGGKELAHTGVFANTMIILQCLCLTVSLIYAGFHIFNKKPCMLLCILYGIGIVVSVVLSGFYFGIFLLELFNIPWFPAQR